MKYTNKAQLAQLLGFKTSVEDSTVPKRFSSLIFRSLGDSTPAFEGLLYVTERADVPAITNNMFWTCCPAADLKVYQFVGNFQNSWVLKPRYTSYFKNGNYVFMQVDCWEMLKEDLPEGLRESLSVVNKGKSFSGNTMVDVLRDKLFDIHGKHAVEMPKKGLKHLVSVYWEPSDRRYYEKSISSVSTEEKQW